MKRRRSLFLHFNQLKLLAKKFALVILFVAAIALMIFSRNTSPFVEQTAGATMGGVASVINILVIPARILTKGYDYLSKLGKIKEDNLILRRENKELKLLKDRYKALEIENKLLTELLNYVPLPEAGFVSAKVVAEENDAFAHSLVAYVDSKNVAKGDVVLSESGVIGRVDKVASVYAKIILITDINSKIPVMIEGSRVRGILSGDNTLVPKLTFVPLDAIISVGDRIVTSGVSGVFPAGLPIGQVVAVSKNEIRVKPFALLDKLEYVKIVKYGLGGLLREEEGQ